MKVTMQVTTCSQLSIFRKITSDMISDYTLYDLNSEPPQVVTALVATSDSGNVASAIQPP